MHYNHNGTNSSIWHCHDQWCSHRFKVKAKFRETTVKDIPQEWETSNTRITCLVSIILSFPVPTNSATEHYMQTSSSAPIFPNTYDSGSSGAYPPHDSQYNYAQGYPQPSYSQQGHGAWHGYPQSTGPAPNQAYWSNANQGMPSQYPSQHSNFFDDSVAQVARQGNLLSSRGAGNEGNFSQRSCMRCHTTTSWVSTVNQEAFTEWRPIQKLVGTGPKNWRTPVQCMCITSATALQYVQFIRTNESEYGVEVEQWPCAVFEGRTEMYSLWYNWYYDLAPW